MIMYYDTVGLRLRAIDVPNVEFLAELPCRFDWVGEYKDKRTGKLYCPGNLGGLKISVSESGLNIKGGSLSKWYKGNNIEPLNRMEVKLAIEKLSDILHVPLHKAFVTRLDVANTIMVNNPVTAYLSRLGELKGYKRMPVVDGKEEEGLYYFQKKKDKCIILNFYDKEGEQKAKGCLMLDCYQDEYWFRFEQRYMKGFSRIFGKPIRAYDLYQEDFYNDIAFRWIKAYRDIQKINNISINFELVKGKRELYTMAVLGLIEQWGGQLNFLTQIEEAQKIGQISKKQAFDIRELIKEICSLETGFTIQNDCIRELDVKMDEIAENYIKNISEYGKR